MEIICKDCKISTHEHDSMEGYCLLCAGKKIKENKKLRELLTEEVVREYVYSECGDHPEMVGYTTKADRDIDAAHKTKDEALAHFIKQALKG